MSDKVDLKVDFCSYEAAKYAVEHWHYSKSKPIGKTVDIGAWEDNIFIGAVVFSPGANNNLVSPYGLKQFDGCELVRVALDKHVSPVSQVVSMAIKLLRNQSSGLRLLVSFADPEQQHVGTIYQAMNWIYTGRSDDYQAFLAPDGKIWHPRMVNERGWKVDFGKARKCWRINQCRKINIMGKHRYLYPLDRAMRKQIEPLRKPYPKNVRPADGSSLATSEATRFDSDADASFTTQNKD